MTSGEIAAPEVGDRIPSPLAGLQTEGSRSADPAVSPTGSEPPLLEQALEEYYRRLKNGEQLDIETYWLASPPVRAPCGVSSNSTCSWAIIRAMCATPRAKDCLAKRWGGMRRSYPSASPGERHVCTGFPGVGGVHRRPIRRRQVLPRRRGRGADLGPAVSSPYRSYPVGAEINPPA